MFSAQVKALIKPGENRCWWCSIPITPEAHVFDELRAYGDLIGVGSYVVATDGVMAQVKGAPRTGKIGIGTIR